ncbi:MAG: DUF6912 family protein [Sporichthyaceae bacterium]
MRVYLPVTMTTLRAAWGRGEFQAPARAFALTPALREWYSDGNAEELEYAATVDAARHCLRLLAAEPGASARRIVVVAEVADTALTLTASVHPAAVALTVPVQVPDVVAVHIDDQAAAADVAAAITASAAADAGDADAIFTVDAVEDHELAWYATQEIAALLAAT